MDLRATNLTSTNLGSSLLTTHRQGNLTSTWPTSALLTTKSAILQNTTLKYSNIANSLLGDGLAHNLTIKRKSSGTATLDLLTKQQKTPLNVSIHSSPLALSSSLFDPLQLSLATYDIFPLEQHEATPEISSHEKLKRCCLPEDDSNINVKVKKSHREKVVLAVTRKEGVRFDSVPYNFKLPEDSSIYQAPINLFTDRKLSSSADVRLAQKRLKVCLINSVSSALIKGPNMKDPADSVRVELVDLCDSVSEFDPEFILKIALYTRQELNIRTMCNLLLAYSAFNTRCRPYLARYFNKCVVLPSDWADVADQYQLFNDKSLVRGSLPSMLRKVLLAKFAEFDVYQLAKYNKSKPTKPQTKPMEPDSDEEDGTETEEDLVRRTFTLKQLVRLLHIKDPAEYVMGLIGKKYPETAEQFRTSRLEGIWKEDMKGKRMKLPIPFTWETQLSICGNTKATWETLIDSKKLPYMATLRNLRNIILAGVSHGHHAKVIKYLTDVNAVMKSRQFPHRFMYAEEVLTELQEQVNSVPEPTHVPSAHKCGKVRPACVEAVAIERKKRKIAAKARSMYHKCPDSLFTRYKNALQTAIDIATFYNVPPISGKTILLLDTESEMANPCKSAKGLGKVHTAGDIAKVLVNICRTACEVFTLQSFSEEEKEGDKSFKDIADRIFTPLTFDRQKVDNVIVLTFDGPVDVISHFVSKYRFAVNPNVLYITVGLGASRSGISSSDDEQNDIFLSGFSDNIFKFISERGNGGQLGYIDRIDVKYDLPPMKASNNTRATQALAKIPISVEMISKPMWKTVKVFISSTFMDMHGERDLLVRYVFPELRSRAKSLFIDVHEVDLRWGITKEEASNSKWLEVCLMEVAKCQLFVGIIGGRYGTIPPSYDTPNANPALDWLKGYPKGSSITELEFHMGALANSKASKGKAFFFIRDDTFHRDVPTSLLNNFVEDCEHSREKLTKLKQKMLASNIETFNRYPCQWGGVSSGKPVTQGLEEFGERVLNNLWTALRNIGHEKETGEEDSLSEKHKLHSEYALKQHKQFVGRKRLVTSCLENIQSTTHKIVAIEGKQGSGKTALMGHLSQLLLDKLNYPVIRCFVGASTALGYSDRILEYILSEIRRISNISSEHEDDHRGNLINDFHSMVRAAASKISKIVILLDGLDCLQTDQQIRALEWLNLEFPKGVTVVCSCIAGGLVYKNLIRQPETKLIPTGPVNLHDRLQIIRNNFRAHGKTLDESFFNNQIQMITSKHESSLPMYLSMVCDELRAFGSYDKLTDKIKSLSDTVEGLIEGSIIRLEVEFGLDIVSGMLGMLVISQNGLVEDDLYMLLKIYRTNCKKNTFDVGSVQKTLASVDQNIPRATFSLLTRALQFLLHLTDQSSDGTLKLSHASISTIIRSRYKKTVLSPNGERLLHHILAGHFWNMVDPTLRFEQFSCIPRALASLPIHFLACGMFVELKNLLCSLNYILAMCLAGMSEQLLDDYCCLLAMVPLSILKSDLKNLDLDKVKLFENFVSRNINILKQYPLLTIQQAFYEPANSPVAIEAGKIIHGNHRPDLPVPVLWENKPDFEDRCRLSIKLSKPALCSALSPDESLIAVGEDTGINVYNFVTGKKIYSLAGHSQEITCLEFLSLSKLCSGSQDGTIAIWNVETGTRISLIKAHVRRVAALSCNNSALSFVSVSWDATIKIWQSSNGDLLSTIKSDTKKKFPFSCMSFHPTKQLIVTGCWDSKIRIVDMKSFKTNAVLHGHSASLRSVCISPNGRIICSTSWDSTLKLWSLNHGFLIANIISLDPFSDAKFSPCGNYLLAGSNDKTVKVYSSRMGKVMSTLKSTRNARITCLSLFNVDTVVCGYQDGYAQSFKPSTGGESKPGKCGNASVTCITSVYAWNIQISILGMQDGKLVAIDTECEVKYIFTGHDSGITSLMCCHDVVFSGSENGTVVAHCIPYRYGKALKKDILNPTKCWVAHDGMVTSISNKWIHSDFATTGADQTLKLWSVESIYDPSLEMTPTLTINTCHVGTIRSSCWIEDPKTSEPLVITTGDDLTMIAWNTVNGTETWTLQDFNAAITYMKSQKHIVIGCSLDGTVYAFSSCGKKLTSIKGDGENLYGSYFKAKLLECQWNQESNEGDDDGILQLLSKNQKHETPTEFLTALAESMRLIYVARSQPSGIIQVIQPYMDDAQETLVGHSDGVTSLSCGLNGRLVTTSLDGTIKLWTAQSGTEKAMDIRHHSEVSCVYCCSEKQIVLTGDRNGFILIWATVSNKWQAVSSTRAHKKAVTGLLTLLNGTLIASVSNDQRLKIWRLTSTDGRSTSPKKLLDLAEEVSSIMEYKLRLEVKKDYSEPITCFDFSEQSSTFFMGFASHRVESVKLLKENNTLSLSEECDVPIWLKKHNKFVGSRNPLIASYSTHMKVIDDQHILVTGSFGEIKMWEESSEKISEVLDINEQVMDYSKKDMIPWKRFMNVCPTAVDISKRGKSRSECLIETAVGFKDGRMMHFEFHFKSGTIADLDSQAPDRFPGIVFDKIQNSVQGMAFVKSEDSEHSTICVGDDDGSLKFWDTDHHSPYKQVAQFFCTTPLRCISSMIQPDTDHGLVICGDLVGNVYFLNVKLNRV